MMIQSFLIVLFCFVFKSRLSLLVSFIEIQEANHPLLFSIIFSSLQPDEQPLLFYI